MFGKESPAWKFRITAVAVSAVVFLGVVRSAAANTEFSAQVDRSQISLDDSVALKFSVKSDGSTSIGQVQFQAPDFDVVNEYTSNYMETTYENGTLSTRNTQQLTKVLHPKKTGDLRITDIQVKADGKVYTAAPLNIHVGAGGAGTPPPQGYGGGGVGLRGAGKRTSSLGFSLRAEVDRQNAYKGEQIIVSYYLYRRVRVFNIEGKKYPTLSGFLREDLEMPMMGPRLDEEQVVLDGVPYARSLLLRYAVYPLKEGKLTIDPLELKFNYYGSTNHGGRLGGADDEMDPFMNFFQQMAPRSASAHSEPLTIDVVPLPEAGKPDSFSGGVGEFSVNSAVDKVEVKANEAVSLIVKVEGRGNVASITEPKTKWPENLELYESKGQAKTGRGGVGEKDFEFLLIPRIPGKMTLPAIEFSFFDPIQKTYVTKKTDPIEINVLPAAPGSVAPPPPQTRADGSANPAAKAPAVIADLKPLTGDGSSSNPEASARFWRGLYEVCAALFIGLLGLLWLDRLRRIRAGTYAFREQGKAKRLLAESKSWQQLRAAAERAKQPNSMPWLEVTHAYERLTGAVYDSIDRKFPVSSRSQSRIELGAILRHEHHLQEELWKKIDGVLENAEIVRFASSAGAVTESAARQNLEKWVQAGQEIEATLRQK